MLVKSIVFIFVSLFCFQVFSSDRFNFEAINLDYCQQANSAKWSKGKSYFCITHYENTAVVELNIEQPLKRLDDILTFLNTELETRQVLIIKIVNSYGGLRERFNRLRSFFEEYKATNDSRIYTFVEKSCQSACLRIFSLGDDRNMHPESYLKLHRTWVISADWVVQNFESFSQNLEEMHADSEYIEEKIIPALKQSSNSEGVILSAGEAVRSGLATHIGSIR